LNVKGLQQNWYELVEPLMVDRRIKAHVFQQLVAAYSQPHRFYHTLTHIRHSLAVLAVLRLDSQTCDQTCDRDFSALQFAVWFHDSVYYPQASDNEQNSAEFAAISLHQLGYSPASISEVIRLILRTQFHQTDADDLDGKILLDTDLAILGTSRSIYQWYARCIRQEYAFVPDFEYNRGRQRVLNAFLQRDRIYATELLHCRLESRARKNIQAELLARSIL
jgi:predicted metal-dependent HD superfamily phosphohydrolase